MAATTMSVTGTLEAPDGSQATGTVTFTPGFNGAHFANTGVSIPNTPVTVTLVSGAIPGGYALVRCTPSTPVGSPANLGGYSVTENVTGAAPYSYVIPDQAGPVDLSSFH